MEVIAVFVVLLILGGRKLHNKSKEAAILKDAQTSKAMSITYCKQWISSRDIPPEEFKDIAPHVANVVNTKQLDKIR